MLVYLIKNTGNGKCYVGQTIRGLDRRLSQHLQDARSKRFRGSLIHAAIRKYGWDAFEVEILEECEEADLDMTERFWIKTYNSLAPNGYNLEAGGSKRKAHSEITRRRMSESHKGWSPSKETRRKMAENAANRVWTPAARRKLSDSQRGKIISAEQREKLSVANTGNNTGEDNGNAKLDWQKVREIRSLRNSGEKLLSIANTFNISHATVSKVCSGKSWIESQS